MRILVDVLVYHQDDLTADQQATLTQFRTALTDSNSFERAGANSLPNTDPTLLRFLKARKFDLNKSIAMWEATQSWRQSFDVEGKYRRYPPFSHPERFAFLLRVYVIAVD